MFILAILLIQNFSAEMSFGNFSKIRKNKFCSWVNIEFLQDFSNGFIANWNIHGRNPKLHVSQFHDFMILWLFF